MFFFACTFSDSWEATNLSFPNLCIPLNRSVGVPRIEAGSFSSIYVWPEKDTPFRQPGSMEIICIMYSGQWICRKKLHVHPDLGYRSWPHHDITGQW